MVRWCWVRFRGVLLTWIQVGQGPTALASGGAMVLGKLPVPGRPTWIQEGQGPTALAVGAGGGCFDIFLSSIISLFFLPLFGRRPDID